MRIFQQARAWLVFLLYMHLPFLILAQDSTITNVSLATAAVAQVANDPSNPLSAALQSIPGLLAQIDAAVTIAVANTVAALTKLLRPEAYYSYGRSPPVYPSRKSNHTSVVASWKHHPHTLMEPDGSMQHSKSSLQVGCDHIMTTNVSVLR